MHFAGVQREGEGGVEDGPVAAEKGGLSPTLAEGQQGKLLGLRVVGTARVRRALPPSALGVGSEETMCESRRRVCLVLAGEFFVCLLLHFFPFRELDTAITNARPNSTAFKIEDIFSLPCFFSPLI